MKLYYLDSGAWLQYYVRGKGSDKVATLFDPSTVLACSAFGAAEVCVALSRMGTAHNIDTKIIKDTAHHVENDWTQFLQVHPSPRLLQLTAEVATKHSLTLSRSLHLGSLLFIKEQETAAQAEIVVVSTDAALLSAAGEYGFSVMNPDAE